MNAIPNRYKIVLVDDSTATLAQGKAMLSEHYSVYTAQSATALMDILDSVTPDLILLDVMMPGVSGFDVMKGLKADLRYKDIPVIFLTSKSEPDSEVEGFDLGATDYIIKPFSAPTLRRRIQAHVELAKAQAGLEGLVKERTAEVTAAKNAVISTVADLIERRDSHTGGHVARTRRYMRLLIDELLRRGKYKHKAAEWDAESLSFSAQLHDVGKIGISDAVLNKPGKLTDEEYEVMKTHVPLGADIIERMMKETKAHGTLGHALEIARTHHEKYNGSGYPEGLSKEDIPLFGRLMAIVDVYDALVSARPYKKAMTHMEAVGIIAGGSGKHFDPELVDVFMTVEEEIEEAAKSS